MVDTENINRRIPESENTNGLTNNKHYSIEEDYPAWKFWKKRRYVVAFMAFLGFFNVYALRVNLSIAIVAMTENRSVVLENGTTVYEREFDWNSEMQGYVLSSFFYGYILTQIPGGWLAARIGGNKVFGVGIVATAILTLITPVLARTNFYLLIAVRIVEGIFEGVTYPCMHALWSKWAPPLERSRLPTIAFSGSYVGTVVAMPVCGLLVENVGWESVFYVFGVLGCIWYVSWIFIVQETPSKDKYISKNELEYITKSLGSVSESRQIKPPWRSILTSAPVWSIVASNFSENWGWYTLLTELPTFMKDTLKFEIAKTGFMSALPYLAMAIMIPLAGQFADWIRMKRYMSTTSVRKVFNCTGFIAQTIFMLGAAYLMTPVGSMICLTFAVGLGSLAWCGFGVNHLDIAPQHASVLMGLGNTFATLPGILSPIITGYVVKDATVEEWRIVFYITSAIYFLGCIVYGLFASGELQPWAVESEPITNNKTPVQGHDNVNYESENM